MNMSVFNTFAKKEKIAAEFFRKKRIFFVGIGGIGVRGIAYFLRGRGYEVGGSDRTESEATAALRTAGIPVAIGHAREHIRGYEILVYTLAIEGDNPELCAAREAGIPTYSRADVLGYLMSLYPTRIAVAGMHGKSTVTAMLAAILREGGKDPAVISGAPLGDGEESFWFGGKETILVEACEYKDSFLCLSPTVAVVLNAEEEHPDYFHSGKEVCCSFSRFLQGTETAILPAARQAVALLPDPCSRVLRFGCEADADDTAAALTYKQGNAAFDYISGGINQGRIELKVPGEHNLQNALAAACAARVCGVAPSAICTALSNFGGTPCRLQARGACRGVDLYEDYAHHPTEIRASLSALRQMMRKNGRLLCLFQAHTYSRTAAFFCDFADALSAADIVVLTDIYAAREQNESGVSAAALAAAIPAAVYEGDAEAAFARLLSLARAGDTVVVMGAGDVRRVLEKIEKEPRG